MSAFDALQRAAFGGFEFPWSKCAVKGGMRDHVHEYPHAPGGDPEKLGRKLYEVHFTIPFHATFNAYPKLWPAQLASLRVLFEGGKTFDLVVPTVGTIEAYAITWEQEAVPKQARSGETGTFVFREDSSKLFLVESLVAVGQSSLADYGARFAALADEKLPGTSLFDGINDAVNSVLSFKDQGDAYGSLLAAKAYGLASLCDQVDKSLPTLNDPRNWEVLDALKDVWASAVKLNQDVLAKVAPFIKFTVPTTMSIGSVSTAIYGDNGHAMDILRMNAIDDAFSIPAGTVLQAYAP